MQTSGSTCEFWVNPVSFTLVALFSADVRPALAMNLVAPALRARSGPVFYPAPREYFLHGCTAVDYFLSPKSSFPIWFSRSRGGPRGPRACSRRARGRPRPAAASAGSPRRRPRPRARSPGDHKGSGSVTVSEIEATTILMDQFLV